MTEVEIQAKLAEFKKAPRHVQTVALWSVGFGIVVLLRMLAVAYTGRISFGKAALYGIVMLCWFWFNGFSIYNRSKSGFVAVAGLALWAFLGVFALSLHLLRLALEGALATDWPDTILSIVGFVQFVLTFVLFRCLLSKDVRHYVWKANPESTAASPKGDLAGTAGTTPGQTQQPPPPIS